MVQTRPDHRLADVVGNYLVLGFFKIVGVAVIYYLSRSRMLQNMQKKVEAEGEKEIVLLI